MREIRGRALALLAQADAAEEEANRLELEQATLDKEVERLTAVVFRMEDMRFSTKQLTNQMQLDTALQVSCCCSWSSVVKPLMNAVAGDFGQMRDILLNGCDRYAAQ